MRRIFDDVETLRKVEKFERNQELERSSNKLEMTIAIIITIIIVIVLVIFFLTYGGV